MNRRGRPPKPEGASTPAQRKAAQRERDRAAMRAAGTVMHELPVSALVESLPSLIARRRKARLMAVLTELGRRGGVTVTKLSATTNSDTVLRW